MEELDDLVDGECHVVGVLERVIGSLDGDELDDVVLGERFGVFEGDHLVFRAVQDQHIVGEVEVLVVERAEGLEVVEEGLVDFHLALEADLDFLALRELCLVGVWDAAVHRLIHVDGRAAQRNLAEGVADFDEVAQRQVAAEARRVDADVFCLQLALGVFGDDGQVGQAFADRQFLARVHAVAGPVKGDDAPALVLGSQVLAEVRRAGRFLVAAEAMRDDGDVVEGPRRLVACAADELAADAEPLLVDIKMLFPD